MREKSKRGESMARKQLSIEASPDLCGSLAWSMFVARKHLKTHRPRNSEEARDCRNSIEPTIDLMDQVGCSTLPKFRKDLLGLCKVKR